jgi:hypothetical protein|tara:strand:- start:250 stop:624 length:375 start_codon:yes stop_codon:yes gene_type:complete
MNTPVNFEIAKLLLDKSIIIKSVEAYIYRGVEHQTSSYTGRLTKDKLLCDIPAPTIADVVMWLYEKNGIWLCVRNTNGNEWHFNYKRLNIDESIQYSKDTGFKHKTPTEAYSAAIEYTLKNLIQ